jgi:sulfoxide reductase heme-binding subunit YedZ
MSEQILWFATRGAGTVSTLMLTASVCLGLVTVTRFEAAGWPKFFNMELHRRLSLLAVVFLVVHIVTAVLDPYWALGWVAALVPLASEYRPIPIALGIVSMYLFVAVVVTSLVRQRIGLRAWRIVHWSSYAMWPLAILHGVFAGTDAFAIWMLVVDAVCLGAVAMALAWRLEAGATNRSAFAGVIAASSWRAGDRRPGERRAGR